MAGEAAVRAAAPAGPATTGSAQVRLDVQGLSAGFGNAQALSDVSLTIHERESLAVIGPSGCGKSTFLRCLNRMHEMIPTAWTEGTVRLDGRDIYESGVDAVRIRQLIGMVLQRPTPFPTMSIRDNVAAGLKVLGDAKRARIEETVEQALRRAALWDEVWDRLHESPLGLSGGQQQRLCVARALAMEPEVLLLDEPTAALDPIATEKIEALVHQLRSEIAVVMVTHSMKQAARVSDRSVFLLGGELIEVGPTQQIFTNPRDPRTEAYVTGRFG